MSHAVAEPKPRRVLLGRIADAHGVTGEVLIHSYAEVPEQIGAYGPLSDATGQRAFQISCARRAAKGVVARLAGVVDRSAAEALKGLELYIQRERLPPPAEDHYYHADLIGLTAIDGEGQPFGRIVAVHNFGAGDLLEISLTASRGSELVPFSDATVPEVDLAAGRARILLPALAEDREG
jgi:16S rRNA processing protein RimM